MVFITTMIFGQDTTKVDTIPKVTMNNNDTSSLSQSNKATDTSMNRNTMDTVPTNRELANRNSQTDSATNKNQAVDRVIMKDDKVMVVKNGDSTLLADSIKLESGAVVTKDGSVKYTSGKTAVLKNGQYINLSNPVDNNSQTDSTTAKPADKTANDDKSANEDKVIMMDGKVFVVKSGDSTLLADSIQLKSGAVVKSDATVRFKDGTTTTLKNGQYIALNPAPAPTAPAPAAPAENKKDTTTTTAATPAPATPSKTEAEDKVVMTDGKVFVVKNGDSTVLEESITLGSGAVVKKDGSVTFKNGTTTQLKNGQFIALNSAPSTETKKTKKVKTTTKKKAKE